MKILPAAALFGAGLLVGILVLLEVGRRIGTRDLVRDPEGARTGVGAIEGAVFGLLGLLVAFTFSGALSRFDDRRHLVTEEANAIGTAWLRIEVLPASEQPALRELFRRYLDSRLETYRGSGDVETTSPKLEKSRKLQDEIWKRSAAAVRASDSPRTALLLPALNEMIDITTTRTMMSKMHPPTVVFAMLAALALTAALLAGYGTAGRKSQSWIHTVGFAVVLALTVYVIVDLEYPRSGLIRVDAVDQVLIELRRGM